jgi:regulator of sirC expression with transglutaminase-like and TPR domain
MASSNLVGATERFAQAVLVNPLDNRHIFRYAAALVRSSRLREAVDQVERVFLRNPNDIDSLVALSDLYRRLHATSAALAFLARAERAQPNDRRLERLRQKLRG